MTSPDFPKYCLNLITLFLEKQHIRARDIRCLRQKVFGYAIDTPEKAEILLLIHENIQCEGEEWRNFFVDALTDYIVYQSKPRRQVSPENAIWLVERIIAGGKQPDATELEAVIRILEMARSAPNLLAALPLTQIRRAILDGHGAARFIAGAPEHDSTGIVSSADVHLIRRVLRAGQNEQTLGISYEEAEVLLDIYRDTEGADNAPEWTGLFVNAIDNAVRFANGDMQASRNEALDQDPSERLRHGVDGFLSRMATAIGTQWVGAEAERALWREMLARQKADARPPYHASRAVAQLAAAPAVEQSRPRIPADNRPNPFCDQKRAAVSVVAPKPIPMDAPLMALVEDLPVPVDEAAHAA
jgi:hypothetical protein